MDAHLAKPFQPEVLYQTLLRVIAENPRKTPSDKEK
jgi:CheY-like chemotaxis protein